MSGAWSADRVRATGSSWVASERSARLLLAVVFGVVLVACGRTIEAPASLVAAEFLVIQAGAASDEATTRPLQGATLSGTVEVILATDEPFDEVRFVLDASTPVAVATLAPFSATIDTSRLPEGTNTLRAVVRLARERTESAVLEAVFRVVRAQPRTDVPVPDPDPDPDPDPEPDPDPTPDTDPDPDPDPDPEPSPLPPTDPPAGWTPPDGAVWIAVGQEPRQVVAAQPAGTTFVFEAGVHRLGAAIVPRAGDTYLGQPGAILSGAKVLIGFERAAGLWAVRGQTQQGYHGPGTCLAEAPRCRYPEELFIDDVRLRHVPRREDVTPGTWTFDYADDTIYIADDPHGRRVETSVTQAAISGDADRVTVRGLVIEKFANPAQRGAVMADRVAHDTTHGRHWRIEDNVVRWNHGVAIRAGHGAVIRGNRVIGNGQLGISSVGGDGTVIEANEIAFNNGAGFDSTWEAGGTKFVATTRLVVRENHVHHNAGPGLWTDIDNIDTLYERNLVEHNQDTGIFHEISYRATIRHNVVRHNGTSAGLERYAYVFGAGILVYASSDVEVYGNLVSDNWNGIVGLMHERGSGTRGRYELRGLDVHGNDVTMHFHPDGIGPEGERGVWGVSGVAQAGGFGFVYEAEANNRFVANRYVVADVEGRHYTWRDGNRRYGTWTQAYGQDAGGTITQGSDVGPLAARP